MKVKVFSTKSKAFQSSSKPPYQLEQDINHWLENNPKINITNIKQSSWQVFLDVEKHFISVWYEVD